MMEVTAIRVKRLPIVLVCAVAIVLAGCATSPDGRQTQAEGAAVGAVLGTIIGAALGGRDGALIGAAMGGGLGFAAGSAVAQEKAKYASEQAFYDAQIQTSRQYAQMMSQQNRDLQVQIRRHERRIADLRHARGTMTSRAMLLAAERKRIQADRVAAETRLTEARKELEFQGEVLAELRKSGDAQRAAALEAQLRPLRADVVTLEGHVNRMAQLSTAVGRL